MGGKTGAKKATPPTHSLAVKTTEQRPRITPTFGHSVRFHLFWFCAFAPCVFPLWTDHVYSKVSRERKALTFGCGKMKMDFETRLHK